MVVIFHFIGLMSRETFELLRYGEDFFHGYWYQMTAIPSPPVLASSNVIVPGEIQEIVVVAPMTVTLPPVEVAFGKSSVVYTITSDAVVVEFAPFEVDVEVREDLKYEEPPPPPPEGSTEPPRPPLPPPKNPLPAPAEPC